MEFFVGLDVSVKTTSVCVMDAGGTITREGKAESSPEAIAAFLSSCSDSYARVGLEASPLCQWLYAGLARAGFPVICIETRHAQAVLSARPNKTDRNDARGIAQMMRVGLYRPVHVKTLASQKIRALLSGRRFLQTKLLDVENSIRGLLRNFGLKVGVVSRAQYEARILELIEDVPSLRVIIEPMLVVRRVVREQYVGLHKKMLALARADDDCLLLMSAPGVGPFVALTYRAAIDEPARFQRCLPRSPERRPASSPVAVFIGEARAMSIASRSSGWKWCPSEFRHQSKASKSLRPTGAAAILSRKASS